MEENNVFENHGIRKSTCGCPVPWLCPRGFLSQLSPRGAFPSHPCILASLLPSPAVLFTLPDIADTLLYFLSPLHWWLSPLTRMQAQSGRGFLSASPAPRRGLAHSAQSVVRTACMKGCAGACEKGSLHLQPALPLCRGAGQQPEAAISCQDDGSQHQAIMTPGRAEWKKERDQDPKDSNPKALPISRLLESIHVPWWKPLWTGLSFISNWKHSH